MDVYPRLGPTSEWDTAAAQAIVEVAGGQVVSAQTGEPLRYNTGDSLLNPHFIVYGDPGRDWLGDVRCPTEDSPDSATHPGNRLLNPATPPVISPGADTRR